MLVCLAPGFFPVPEQRDAKRHPHVPEMLGGTQAVVTVTQKGVKLWPEIHAALRDAQRKVWLEGGTGTLVVTLI